MLVDDTSGTTLGTWQQTTDYEQARYVDLSATGGALYAEQACSGGHTLMQLWPTPSVMRGCTTGAIETRVMSDNYFCRTTTTTFAGRWPS